MASFDFDQCMAVLLNAIVQALDARADAVRGIKPTAHGTLPITGVSFDVTPWHGSCALSIRLSSDPRDDAARWNSADWELSEIISPENCDAFGDAGALIAAAYEAAGEDRLDIAHLIFLASACALLDAKVAAFFHGLGVKVPVVGDRLNSHYFEWIVTDPDGTVKGNYCEIVRANRVTQRLLGRVI